MSLPQWQDESISEAVYRQYYSNDPLQKWELIDSIVYAMAGASRRHVDICMNLGMAFKQQLKGKPCRPYMSDLAVRISETTYYYPDIVVDCGDDDNTANQPLLIVEVLSKSTAFLDKTKKLMDYVTLPSLQEYAIVEQDTERVTVFHRLENWQANIYKKGDTVWFESLGLSMRMDDVYDGVF